MKRGTEFYLFNAIESVKKLMKNILKFSITCAAGVGTFIVEFGALSRLTGDPIYEEVALNAIHALYQHKSNIGLYGNHIDVQTGRWTGKKAIEILLIQWNLKNVKLYFRC